MKPRILIVGANGQIGTDLAYALAARYGADAVVLSDIAAPPAALTAGMTHHILDATDADALQRLVVQQGITQIYLLAAALSARGEQHPAWAWDLNMRSLLNVLELAPVPLAGFLAQLDRRLRVGQPQGTDTAALRHGPGHGLWHF